MKKDRMYELMTELRDRQFDLDECHDLFSAIHGYLLARELMLADIGTEKEEESRSDFNHFKEWLQKELDSKGLSDYTIDEFITED